MIQIQLRYISINRFKRGHLIFTEIITESPKWYVFFKANLKFDREIASAFHYQLKNLKEKKKSTAQMILLTNLQLFFEGTTSPRFSRLLYRSLARVQQPCLLPRDEYMQIEQSRPTKHSNTRFLTLSLRREPVISSDNRT